MSGSKLSIIMPVLNEAANIDAAVTTLAPYRERGVEVIVVDGGSRDGTPALVRPFADQVCVAACGRAVQMNAGRAVARGEVLLFLHADTRLPENADALITDCLARSGRVWGRFDVRFDRGGLLRLVAITMNLRSRLTGIATGDQALMEDVWLCMHLKRIGRPLCLRARVTTSARRWQAHGILRTILLMWRLRLAFFFGADPAKLARQYGYVPAEQ